SRAALRSSVSACVVLSPHVDSRVDSRLRDTAAMMAVSRRGVFGAGRRPRSVFCIMGAMKPEPNRRTESDPESTAALQTGLKILDSCATIVRYESGQEIGHEPDQVERWYRIVSGVARKCVVLPNGRRQILDLLLAGDFFGIDTQPPQQHCYCEAVVDG